MKSPKVLHVVHAHCAGSLERLIIQLARSLKKRGDDVQIAFIRENDAFPSENTEGLKTHILDQKEGKLISKIYKIIKAEGINVVHTHDLESIKPGSLAARLAFIRCIHTKHVRTYKTVSNFYYNLNTFVVCVSEDIKKDLLSCNRVSEKKIQVLYNGIDLEAIDRRLNPKERQRLRKELGVSDSTFLIGNIGRLIEEEDQASIIKALAKMVARELNAELLIAGDGPLKENLERIAKDYNVSERVKIVDYNGSTSDLFNAMDCLILTTFSEGRPFTILEAMAARKPVIATAIGANKEVVEERKNGYLVSCGFPERIHSAVMRLNAIESLAEEIGAAGRKKVEEGFSLDQMARGYNDLYNQL